MYNGIGLQTPRGSGTNGYVQRNMSFVPKSREKVNYKTEDDIKKLDALSNRKPNQGILAHERKRTIELKCVEMQELMEEQGYPDEEIDAKVALFRKMLIEKEMAGEVETPKDEFGRPLVKESHQIAEANQEKNAKMREALGISPFFVEGSSLDPERKAKEAVAAAAEEAKKKYTLIPDSSSDSAPERSQEKDKNKKRKKKKSHSSREKIESSSKKKKNVKKHKKDRSVSPDVQKKKKPKKANKDKSRHKSGTHKKHTRSSSSSSDSSSESADDESSSRSSSRSSMSEVESDVPSKKLKNSSKLDKNRKERRKRSSSSESIRYPKDSRSRKDIYEAKKAKKKRKPSRSSSSSSSDDSSPKQYFRLEPVLLKSKSKHKRSHQIIEIPKKNAFELKKYDKKKRTRQSSSSDEEEIKNDSKRRKKSGSPALNKHRSGRETAKETKPLSSHKTSERESHSSATNKHRRDRSRSNSSLHTSQNKARSVSHDDGDDKAKKRKGHPREEKEQQGQTSHKIRKKSSRNDSISPRHNGMPKKTTRSYTPESDASKRSIRSSSSKHKKHIPKSPSQSPPVYKHKKHVIDSPDHVPNTASNKKKVQSTSSPRKEKHHRSRELSSDSSPDKSTKKQERSHRSHSSISEKSSKDHKRSYVSSNGASKVSRSPVKKKSAKESRSRSSSLPRSSKTRAKHGKYSNDTSPSQGNYSDDNDHKHSRKTKRPKDQDFKDDYRDRSRSPIHHKKKNSELKQDKIHTSSPSPIRNKNGYGNSSKHAQSSPSRKDSYLEYRESQSLSPDRTVRGKDSKRQKSNKSPGVETLTIKVITNKDDHIHERSPKQDKLVYSRKSSSPHTKHLNENATLVSETNEESSDLVKSKWLAVSSSDHPTNSIPNQSSTEAPYVKNVSSDPQGKEEGAQYAEKQNETRPNHPISKKEKSVKHSPTRSSSITKISGQEKSHKSKDSKKKVRKSSHSRSRSISNARSCSASASDHSSRSRSRSYSKSRSKSYSKSRSKSYSKSRSRSRSHSHRDSRSRTRSRSCTKSYSRSRSASVSACSRSRSRSYSSRSRSRSIARSPSIPRRRGSPSFLDKRRITSARKRPVPYRRPSPPTPSSTSSWSYHTFSRSSSPLHPTMHSPASVCSSRSFGSRSQSWSPILKQKYELTLNSALR